MGREQAQVVSGQAGSTTSIRGLNGRKRGLLFSGLLAALVLAGCGSSSSPSGGPGGPPDPGNGGGGSGPAVRIGNDFFRSGQNNSANPAVDTVAVGETVTWTWVSTGQVQHSVQSLGAPSFPSSVIQGGSGSSYHAVFLTAGTYRYNCAVHGNEMTGTIVVQ
jgi:plastocyanin